MAAYLGERAWEIILGPELTADRLNGIRLFHDSILSQIGASGNPGAVQQLGTVGVGPLWSGL